MYAEIVDDDSLRVFDLSDLNKTTELKASDIGVEDINYIPLEFKPNSRISYINKIEADKNSFYISSYDDVKRFDSKGKFLAKIGQKGKGPAEIILINDFSTDINSNVYILSRYQKKIFVYSNKGEFIRTLPAPYAASELLCFNDGIVCYSKDMDGTVENSFHLINYDGKILKQFPNKNRYPGRITYARGDFISLCRNAGKVYIKEQISDTIFSVSEKNMNSELVLGRGEKLITREFLSKAISFPSLENAVAKYIIDLRTIILPEYVYLEFIQGKNGYCFFTNLKKSVGYLMSLDEHGIINDYDGGPDIWMKSGLDNNSIISWMDALELKAYVASEAFKISTPKYPEKKKELEKLANRLSNNDNPVLIIVKLKD